ncbi:MAG: hypothetical protein WB621_00005, partial [Candidatus Acidiferrales bacterium]
FTDSLGEENFLRDERHEQYRAAVPPLCPNKNFGAQRKLTSTRNDVNLFQRCNVTACAARARPRGVSLQFDENPAGIGSRRRTSAPNLPVVL